MIVRYDSLNRLEAPKLTLCNLGSRCLGGQLTNMVGVLSDHEAEEIVFNFNATSELNFRINRLHQYKTSYAIPDEDVDRYKEVDRLYKAVQNRRLIFVEDVGYFMVVGVTEGYDGHNYYRDVNAQSIDIELQQKVIPFIADGTYRFETDFSGQNKGILNMIAEILPMWTIGHVDETISEKWRTFEDVDTSTNCLAFLLENLQDAYECIILFDIVNRVINVYDQMSYVRETRIHITNDDVIDSLEIKEASDDVYTAITALGNEESITIAAVNPLGTNTIYNFSYYLDWMSDGLRNKVVQWQADIEANEKPYQDASQRYYEKMSAVSIQQFEIERLTTQMTLYQRCKDNIVASNNGSYVGQYNEAILNAGGTPITISDQISEMIQEIGSRISEVQDEIDVCTSRIVSLQKDASAYREQIDVIVRNLTPENYFIGTSVINGVDVPYNYMDELQNYIFEGSYTDEYVTVTDIMGYAEQYEQMKTMYTRAKQQLLKASYPTQEFSIDVENFVFAKDFERWSEDLETGCLISVELDEDDVAKLFLSNITINYDDHSLSMTFGNRFNRFDPKSLFEDVLGSVSKSANTLNYVKDVLYPIKAGELDVVKQAIQRSRDLTMGSALASDNQEVVIDASGYTGREVMSTGEYDPRQIKITGRNIVFTDDAWETSKTAIGELVPDTDHPDNTAYGINAEMIVGEMIVGDNIRIMGTDANGQISDIFSIVDNKISTQVSDQVGTLRESTGSELNNMSAQISSLEQTAGDITATIANWKTNGVDSVRTGKGYRFDDTGLMITELESGSGIRNLITNDGMYVQLVTSESEDPVNMLMATDEGVDAVNLTAHNYLTIGLNSRFEDYPDPHSHNLTRTACFLIDKD